MASPQTDTRGQIVPAPKEKPAGLIPLVQSMMPDIQRALPKHITAERMTRIVQTALRTSPKLAQCEPGTFLACVLNCAVIGLEPNTPLGHAYLIPRNNNRTKKVDCTLLIGYAGMLELSYRSGMLRSVDADVVHEGDDFQYSLGLKPYLRLVPQAEAGREEKPITHAYAIFRLNGDAEHFTVLSRAQIEKRRLRSAAATDGPWVTDLAEMCKKSAIRAGWKYIPKSAEMARAMVLDEAPERGVSQYAESDPTVLGLLESQGYVDATGAIDTNGTESS